MRYVDGAAHVIAAGGVATRNASAFNADTRIISLYADVPVYMAFGDAHFSDERRPLFPRRLLL